MAGKFTCMGAHAALTLTIILVTATIVIGHVPPAPTTQYKAPCPPVPSAHDTAPPVPTAHDTAPPVPTAHDTAPPVPTAHDTAPPSPATHDTAPPVPATHVTTPPSPATHDTAPPAPATHVTAPPAPATHVTTPPAPATHVTAPPVPATHVTTEEVPAESSKVEAWFQANIAQQDTLEPALAAAEAAGTVIKVKQDGSCQFKTITDAINSIPAGNTKRMIVNIGEGTYNEKVTIPKNKPFVTLVGSANSKTVLTYSGTALKFGALNSATLIVEADYFVASNLVIKNESPRPFGKFGVGAQAVALRLSGNRAALYGCKMIGFQDTICDDKGNHFFKDCYIEGAVDFIFGSGKSMYLKTVLHVVEDAGIAGMKYISGNAKDAAAENTGYSFVHSNITGTSKSSGTLLARAWKATAGAQITYAFTSLSKSVSSLGLSNDNKAQNDNTALFGEYQCIGPGSLRAAVDGAKFAKQLTHEQAKSFISLSYIQASKWLLPPPTPVVF